MRARTLEFGTHIEGHAQEGHAHARMFCWCHDEELRLHPHPLVQDLRQRLLWLSSIPKELRVLSVFDVFALLPFRSPRAAR